MRVLGIYLWIVLAIVWMYPSVSYASVVEMRQDRWDHLAALPGFDSFSQAYRGNDFTKAGEAVNELLTYYPDETYLYFLRGLVSLKLQRYSDARDDLTYYIQCDPEDIDGYKMIVYASMQDGAYEDAMYYCQRGLERNPDHTYLLKCEAVARERLDAERRREVFTSIGVGMDNPYMQDILQFINEKRRQACQAELSMHAVLNQAAQKRAQELITSFSHTRPDGTPFLSVMREFDIPYHFAGELVYKGSGGIDGVVAAWRQKYTDQDLGIDPETEYVGIGYVEENGITYLVQIFML